MQTMEVSLQEVRCGSKKALRGPSSRGLCKIVRQWFYWHTQIMTNTTIPKHRSLKALKLHFCFPESHEWSNRAPCVSLPTPEITVQIQTLLAPCCVREIGRQFLSFLNLLARKIELSPMIQRGTRTSTIGFLLRITISKYYIILLYDIAKPPGRFLGASDICVCIIIMILPERYIIIYIYTLLHYIILSNAIRIYIYINMMFFFKY